MNQERKWRLAPAYDETFTVNFKNRFIGDRHVMTIAESDRNISMDQFMRLADENDVKNAGSIVREIAEVVNAFTGKAEEAQIGSCHTELIAQFIKTKTDAL